MRDDVQSNCIIVIIVLYSLLVGSPASAEDKSVFFRDNFETLDSWKPLYFKNIEKHTEYSIDKEGEGSYLKAESNASASGIVFKQEFSVFDYPKIRWRWRVSNIFLKGNATEKAGDDYPLRIYIIFKYDPETASFGRKFKYGVAKKLYGEYPPDSSLNYIWANRKHDERLITNTYALEAKMVLLQQGPDNAGQWIEQEVDIVEDYHRAFKKDPPATASIAIMNDSDNTGESAISYIDYIEVFRN